MGALPSPCECYLCGVVAEVFGAVVGLRPPTTSRRRRISQKIHAAELSLILNAYKTIYVQENTARGAGEADVWECVNKPNFNFRGTL